MKKKVLIKLISTSGSKHFYIKNNCKNKKKLRLKKFDPRVRKHFIYEEIKIK